MGHETADLDPEPLAQIFPGDRAGCHAHRRFPGRRAATAAVIPNPVFLLVAVVRMPGSKLVLDIAVIARPLIRILDQEPDRRAGRPALENAGQDPDEVCLLARRRVPRLSRTPSFQVVLDIGLAEFHARRATVDDTAHRRTVALAEACHRE